MGAKNGLPGGAILAANPGYPGCLLASIRPGSLNSMPSDTTISAPGLLDVKTRPHPFLPFFHQEQTADAIQKPAGVHDVGRIALPGRHLTVGNVVAERRAGL